MTQIGNTQENHDYRIAEQEEALEPKLEKNQIQLSE